MYLANIILFTLITYLLWSYYVFFNLMISLVLFHFIIDIFVYCSMVVGHFDWLVVPISISSSFWNIKPPNTMNTLALNCSKSSILQRLVFLRGWREPSLEIPCWIFSCISNINFLHTFYRKWRTPRLITIEYVMPIGLIFLILF